MTSSDPYPPQIAGGDGSGVSDSLRLAVSELLGIKPRPAPADELYLRLSAGPGPVWASYEWAALDDLVAMNAATLPLDLGSELLMAMNEGESLALAGDYALPDYGDKPKLPCDSPSCDRTGLSCTGTTSTGCRRPTSRTPAALSWTRRQAFG